MKLLFDKNLLYTSAATLMELIIEHSPLPLPHYGCSKWENTDLFIGKKNLCQETNWNGNINKLAQANRKTETEGVIKRLNNK